MTKTLVIVTIPGIGKTWYKNVHDVGTPAQKENPDYHLCDLIFDMNLNKYGYNENLYKAFENVIYITRKHKLDSIIMINYSNGLLNLMRNNNIPFYGLIPPPIIRNAPTDTESYSRLKMDIRSISVKNKSRYLKTAWNGYSAGTAVGYLVGNVSDMWSDENYFSEWEEYDKEKEI